MDEKSLLQDLRDGSRDAFEKLYFNYAEQLMVKLLLLVKSEDLAKDLLQEVFMKIWQMREQIDPDRSFGALLYRMSTNLSYNSFRSTLRESNRRKAVYSGEGYSHIEEDVDYQETSQLLEAALSGLSNRQRKIYTLQKLEGKSYKEISELLGISHSAINQNLQVANKYIRFFMKSRLPILLFLISSQIE